MRIWPRRFAALAALPPLLAAALALSVPAAVAADEPPQPLGADAVWAWWWPGAGRLAEEVAGYGFDRVYLYAQGGFDAKVRKAIAALGARGIAVEALGGERRWATTQRAGMLRFVRSARRYERNAPPQAQLAGIHVDVEPYGLPAWDRDAGRVGRSLIKSLRAARRAAGVLPLAADIPFWYGPRLARGVIAATDATSIMAYRDSGLEVIDAAAAEVRIAGELGRRATVGVETGDYDPPSITFFEEGRGALIEAIGEVDVALGSRAGFGGTAIHHLGSLADLQAAPAR